MTRKQKNARPCPHIHTLIATTGALRFVGGDVVDDLRSYEVCLDCGGVVRRQRKPETLTGHRGVVFGFRDMVTREFQQGVDF